MHCFLFSEKGDIYECINSRSKIMGVSNVPGRHSPEFQTVADEFGLTQENCPKHTSFIPLCFLETQMNWGWHMYALYDGKKIIGYMSLSKESDDAFELHNLAVLPEYRHNGFGKLLLDFAKEKVISLGGTKIKIGIIEESIVLKNWYIANGFAHIGTKKFDHLPFTSGYLEWKAE